MKSRQTISSAEKVEWCKRKGSVVVMITRAKYDELKRKLDEVSAFSHKLNKWEMGFIESLSDQFDATGTMSPKQEEKLDDIWMRNT